MNKVEFKQMIKYLNDRFGKAVILLGMFCLLLFSSCKEDEEKAFGLTATNLELYQNETKEIIVTGAEEFTVSLSDPLVVDIKVNASVIQIKGIRIGTTQLKVKLTSGEEKICNISVKESQQDADISKNSTTRIEWGNTVYYPEEKDGFIFALQNATDALGMIAGSNTVAYDFSVMGDVETWLRISASGDFTKPGSLSDGLVVLKKPGARPESYIALSTVLKEVKDGKAYLILYLSGVTVRVVTPAVD